MKLNVIKNSLGTVPNNKNNNNTNRYSYYYKV